MVHNTEQRTKRPPYSPRNWRIYAPHATPTPHTPNLISFAWNNFAQPLAGFRNRIVTTKSLLMLSQFYRALGLQVYRVNGLNSIDCWKLLCFPVYSKCFWFCIMSWDWHLHDQYPKTNVLAILCRYFHRNRAHYWNSFTTITNEMCLLNAVIDEIV